MNAASYLLDSDVFIDLLDEVPVALKFMREHLQSCMVSPVTRAEVLAGLKEDHGLEAQVLLDLFPCLLIDAEVGDRAGRLRQGSRLKTADAIQLALAQAHGCKLVTRNSKDFKRYTNIHIPYEL